jgi:quinol monooxygenase YgiN
VFGIHNEASCVCATLLSILQPRKENFMFTRIVEVTTKPGKAYDIANAINEDVLPILRQQPGFIDETILISEMESNRVLAMSVWKSKEDAERYHKEHFSKITEMISRMLEGTVVRTFNVHTSTAHKVAAGIAA